MTQNRARQEDADAGGRIAFFLLGGMIGAVAALLLAPKSGRELRADIADTARKGVDQARERAGEYYEVGRERAAEMYTTAANKAGEIYATAADKATEIANAA